MIEQNELSVIVNSVGRVVKQYVATALKSVSSRIDTLEELLTSLPVPKDGRDADPEVIRGLVSEAIERREREKEQEDPFRKAPDVSAQVADLQIRVESALSEASFRQKFLPEFERALEANMSGLIEALTAKVAETMPKPSDGIDGRDGKDGERGERGEKGEIGLQGPPGPSGEPGQRGERGEMGIPGEKGMPGIDGIRGERGEPGERGEQGQKGDVGMHGQNGERGEPGIDGRHGERGEQGLQGERGLNGDPGPMGERGETGESGKHGERGEQGERGERGLDGRDAKDGRDGLNGKDGAPGRDAIQIDILPTIDLAKSYPRGTYGKYRKGVIRAYRDTVPGNSLDECGFEVIWDSHVGVTVEQSEDMRHFTFKFTSTSGEINSDTFFIPVPIYRDVYKVGNVYERGHLVSHQGSMWVCIVDSTSESPSSPSVRDWRLCVKAGRDLREVAPTNGKYEDRKPISLK